MTRQTELKKRWANGFLNYKHVHIPHILIPLSPTLPAQTFPITLLIKNSFLCCYFLPFWVPMIFSFHPGLILFGPFA